MNINQESSTGFKFLCALCGQSLEAEAGMEGMAIDCPACRKSITIPGATVAEPARPTRKRIVYSPPAHAAARSRIPPAAEYVAEKNIPLAIGLNLLLPGVGYMYMGRVLLGICAFFIIFGVLLLQDMDTFYMVLISGHAIMLIDMLILGGKNKKAHQASAERTCPQCAESIKRSAVVCRFCGARF
jgi:DNA-directed RNA polymerase subunit RPC12/RpoP